MLHYSAINVANSATKLSIFCRITKGRDKITQFLRRFKLSFDWLESFGSKIYFLILIKLCCKGTWFFKQCKNIPTVHEEISTPLGSISTIWVGNNRFHQQSPDNSWASGNVHGSRTLFPGRKEEGCYLHRSVSHRQLSLVRTRRTARRKRLHPLQHRVRSHCCHIVLCLYYVIL